MILSDRDLEEALNLGNLKVDPIQLPIQPASIDLRLGTQMICPNGGILDRERGIVPEELTQQIPDAYMLFPGHFINVSTLEWVEIHNPLVGQLVGKSSLARDGLQVEAAGYVDPGWKGRLTLELINLGPYILMLRPGMKIVQLRVMKLTSPALRLYGQPGLNSHYNNAIGPEMGSPKRADRFDSFGTNSAPSRPPFDAWTPKLNPRGTYANYCPEFPHHHVNDPDPCAERSALPGSGYNPQHQSRRHSGQDGAASDMPDRVPQAAEEPAPPES